MGADATSGGGGATAGDAVGTDAGVGACTEPSSSVSGMTSWRPSSDRTMMEAWGRRERRRGKSKEIIEVVAEEEEMS